MTPDLFSQPDYTIPFNQHRGNQETLDTHRKHFSGQAKIVLDLLLSGESVSSREMFSKYNIVDTRARIFGLRKKGFKITEYKIPFAKGAKYWRMTNEDLKCNSH